MKSMKLQELISLQTRLILLRLKDKPSKGVYREIYNLSQLEDCRSTPRLLDHAVEKQDSSDELPGGFIMDLEDVEQHTNLTKDDVCLVALEQLEYWSLIEGQHNGALLFHKDELLEDLKARLYKQ
ncbi:uncharacterized protein BO96DRAFT_436977 [Aspergillus niger CBS 101883]|uniref:Contig An12c0060, genomic contig n=2 Tax=Aspergillus niger TaxID=5061 RepID=A2QYM8_ASPNC|nr:uncharacterized protein BO96DRAFT_436977 [Aspergillus niger CBS 101883]XP_059605529.1 uncharacterized protein An12g01810 [Aspergillus niger]PYH53686.1 hypothetical protein BO96DRAFT_436977 [Aspergillus niger CBS 101883]CAK48463.1 unnamed protein product [Aspergillus niger]